MQHHHFYLNFLEKILKLSQTMIETARSDEEAQTDLGLRLIASALRDYGYALKKMVEKELDAKKALLTDPTHIFQLLEGLVRAGHPKKIFIIDDDQDFVSYLAMWLQDYGFITKSAANGKEALEQLATWNPDLITLDIDMPQKSGISTYQELRYHEKLKNIPIIVITAMGQPFCNYIGNRPDLPELDGFIVKPIDLMLLAKTLIAVLVQRGLERKSLYV